MKNSIKKKILFVKPNVKISFFKYFFRRTGWKRSHILHGTIFLSTHPCCRRGIEVNAIKAGQSMRSTLHDEFDVTMQPWRITGKFIRIHGDRRKPWKFYLFREFQGECGTNARWDKFTILFRHQIWRVGKVWLSASRFSSAAKYMYTCAHLYSVNTWATVLWDI